MRQNSGADWEEWYKPAGAVMHVFGRSLWRGFSVLLFAGDENKEHSSHSMSAPVLRIARFKHLLSRQHVSSTADSPHPPPPPQATLHFSNPYNIQHAEFHCSNGSKVGNCIFSPIQNCIKCRHLKQRANVNKEHKRGKRNRIREFWNAGQTRINFGKLLQVYKLTDTVWTNFF